MLGCPDTVPAAERQAPFAQLANGPWRVRGWAGRPFIFLSYAGAWSQAYQRFAYECKVQKLLTPTWEDSTFPHPIESAATEWGWNVEPTGKTRRECWAWMHKYYLDKIAPAVQAGKPFYSLTGHGFYSIYGAQWGGDMVGLETGENILGMQAQLAFLRGGARQNAKPFYVQPSPWFGGTVPRFRAGEDETTPHTLDVEAVRAGIAKGGIAIPNGGHSSSLLARMWYVAWLSGAAIVCPEACQSNFFCGSEQDNAALPPEQRMVLSPLGRRAQTFLRLVETHPERGIPYTPFALLLDPYCGFNGFQLTQPRPWNVLTPTLADREISLWLDTLFPRSLWLDLVPGVDEELEDRRLVRSPYGDSFDVLLSNAPQEILVSYPVLLCLGAHEFLPETVEKLRLYVQAGGRLFLTHAQAAQLGPQLQALRQAGQVEQFGLTPRDIPAKLDVERWYTPPHWGASAETLASRKRGVALLPYEQRFVTEVHRLMARLAKEYLPVRVSGDVEFLVNRTERGWIVGLINNAGVTKSNMTPVKLDATQRQTVTIRQTRERLTEATEWCQGEPLAFSPDGVRVDVPPGEVRIVELRTRNRVK
jgi:hypothetical protein